MFTLYIFRRTKKFWLAVLYLTKMILFSTIRTKLVKVSKQLHCKRFANKTHIGFSLELENEKRLLFAILYKLLCFGENFWLNKKFIGNNSSSNAKNIHISSSLSERLVLKPKYSLGLNDWSNYVNNYFFIVSETKLLIALVIQVPLFKKIFPCSGNVIV